MYATLICYCCSQVFDFAAFFEGYVSNQSVMILPCISVVRQPCTWFSVSLLLDQPPYYPVREHLFSIIILRLLPSILTLSA